jgi:spermidine synthase
MAAASLMLELLLMRAFDVMLTPGMAYLVVSSAVFSIGVAGIYATLRPLRDTARLSRALASASLAFALASVLVLPAMNLLPFDFNEIMAAPVVQLLSFAGMYLFLVAPFLLVGWIFATTFSVHAEHIKRLYFFDLVGAGVGCLCLLPLLPLFGPGGAVLIVSGLGLVSSGIFAQQRSWIVLSSIVAVVMFSIPLMKMPDYFEFKEHAPKRGIRQARADGRIELIRWDPISKITIVDETWSPAISHPWHLSGDRKHIAYDGGNQSSFFYRFDGDLGRLRRSLDRGDVTLREHFWQRGVLASHYLKRDSDQSVLILGSAGGQETKAALLYGAARVDAVELVGAVIDLGRNEYSDYIGDIFHNPAVRTHAGEGRSFLRQTSNKYDIIQMYSNHTSSSIAQGTGALAPKFLQTAEAYGEYFRHLKRDGVLHINHPYYPRMITTAALAWKESGNTNFERHVVVFTNEGEVGLPTVLIKMTPWSSDEIQAIEAFLEQESDGVKDSFTLAENPTQREQSFLSADFYSGEFPQSLAEKLPVDFRPCTDDEPYFSLLRKHHGPIDVDPAVFVDDTLAKKLNSKLRRGWIPMDTVHLYVFGVISVVFALLAVFLPIRFSRVGREHRRGAGWRLAYFACLGTGFIIIELVFIQTFVQLIGYPFYAFATIIVTLLLSAGLGSVCSDKWGIGVRGRWFVPFVAILGLGLLITAVRPWLFDLGLALPTWGRIFLAGVTVFPLGFFLGMPFPLGVLSIQGLPRSAVAWAWGINGVATVVGGFLSVILSVKFGYTNTLLVALGIYAIAALTFPGMRRGSPLAASVDPQIAEALPGERRSGDAT